MNSVKLLQHSSELFCFHWMYLNGFDRWLTVNDLITCFVWIMTNPRQKMIAETFSELPVLSGESADFSSVLWFLPDWLAFVLFWLEHPQCRPAIKSDEIILGPFTCSLSSVLLYVTWPHWSHCSQGNKEVLSICCCCHKPRRSLWQFCKVCTDLARSHFDLLRK